MLRTIAVLSFAVLVRAADDRVKVDNDTVRILNAVQEPHQKTELHEHVFPRVLVYLNAGELTIRHEDGRVERQRLKAGQVAWSPAGGKHTSENTGKHAIRIIEIELKKPAPAQPAHRAPDLDPVVIDTKHNILQFENDQVRVFRSWREPGASERMHEHTGAGRVAVLLTDLDVTIQPEGNSLHAPAGDVRWTPGPEKHAATNVGKQRFDMFVIEVK
jgi:quercetin dioxygenase-like cupin family protein